MSRKSKKYVLLVTILITIASMIAACGAPQTEPAATQAPAQKRPPPKPRQQKCLQPKHPTEAPATEAPLRKAHRSPSVSPIPSSAVNTARR